MQAKSKKQKKKQYYLYITLALKSIALYFWINKEPEYRYKQMQISQWQSLSSFSNIKQ